MKRLIGVVAVCVCLPVQAIEPLSIGASVISMVKSLGDRSTPAVEKTTVPLWPLNSLVEFQVECDPNNQHIRAQQQRDMEIQRVAGRAVFYEVDGLFGSETDSRVDIRRWHFINYNLWRTRINCPDNRVSDYQKTLVALPNREPGERKCLWSRTTRSKETEQGIEYVQDEIEQCNNFSKNRSRPIQVGEVIVESDVDPAPNHLRGVRQWRGRKYQWFLTKPELHNGTPMTLMGIMVEGPQSGEWIVVDKF